jgi:penicillin-insensitive murein endopeptidase
MAWFRTSTGFGVVIFIAAVPSPVHNQPPLPAVASPSSAVHAVVTPPPVSATDAREIPVVTGQSQSIGLPHRGRLRNAARLEPSAFVRFKVGSSPRERYATDEMVALVQHAARHVERIVPGAPLTVGDISRRTGGVLFPHRSHRTGRDVDLVYYARSLKGAPAKPDHFVRYRADGTGQRGPHVYLFDAKRNWELVAYLLDNPIAEVQQIFVAPHIRALLLAEAHHRGEPGWLVHEAERVMTEKGGRHDDHLHVRIACAEDDRRCRELPGW